MIEVAAKLNHRVTEVLEQLVTMEPGKDLTITCHGDHFQLFNKGEQIAEDLTLADLRNISRHSVKLKIVQLVDVSHLVFSDQVRSTDAYLKIEDDIARAFLHVIHRMKFQKPGIVATPKGEVAI
ncbi:MAG: hypothetical protein ABFC12_05945 [Methanobacterium sp.]